MAEIFSFGAWVRRRRKALDLTQAELAARAGCTESMLRKVEADARQPSRQLAERLATVLKLPAAEHDWFLKAARGEPAADHPAAPAPVWAQTHPHTGGLPAQPTSFVGRDKERMLLRLLLRRGDVRLLTLTGPGGVGKTRLALQIATELAAEFPDGVVFVPLAPVADPARIIPSIATACGVPDIGDRPPLDRLCAALRDRRMLLLLDNFEHVLAAAADLATLLAATATLKLLATSRAALHLAWEHDFAVPPLALPTRGMHPSLEQLSQYDAVRLFVARAQAANPAFTLTDENAPAVAEICRRLDGLPLAIELATARCRHFTPQALLARLDRRLALLTSGPRDMPERQQTLRGLIDWSYNLLEGREQLLLARMGVFADGCSLETAEAVCSSPEDGPIDLLDQLLSLVDKSLIQQVQGLAGEPRFVLLETIREYALEQLLAGGEQEAIRRKHAEACLRLAETAARALEGAQQGAWLGRLQQEHDNLRAALAWTVERREAESGIRLAVALRLFWFMRGYLTEGRAWLGQLLALPNASAHDRARALDCAGFLARYQGDYDAAAGLIGESLALWRSLASTQGIADALGNLGYVRLYQGDSLAARTLYEESLGLNRALDNPQGIADCLIHLGAAAFFQGDAAAARAFHEEALSIWERLGDTEGVAYAQYHLGDVALSQGELGAAARWFAASLATAVELEWPLAISSAVEGAASLAVRRGRPAMAVRLAAFAAHMRQAVAIPLSPERAQLLEQRLAPTRLELAGQVFADTWAAGEALTFDQAVEAARAELAAADQGLLSSRQSGGHEALGAVSSGLTAREREVAILIAQGLSNREIAAALVVGIKTVEAHISRVLAKLGFSSRARIAAWAVEHGLTRSSE
jgi:predicted ATPase/DNA-binding CsgD family transcriptional regulator/transcriptional regulator with XRE-family HTH domain